MSKFCPNCGTELNDDAVFCNNCGQNLGGNQAQQVNITNVNVNPNQKPAGFVQNRSIVTCILLSIVTCGIYSIIWFINLVNDSNTVCQDNEQSGGTVFLLTLVTCGIYGIVWVYKVGKRLNEAGTRAGINIADNSLVYLLLEIFGLGLVDYCLIQSDLNKFSA